MSNKLTTFNRKLAKSVTGLQDFSLFIVRLILAYGFSGPALKKLQDIHSIADWFSSMDIPFPTLNAYLATTTEVLGFVFLALGFATRFISIPLMVVMLVAIQTVHWVNGFEASENGFEIPLYYLVMLFVLLSFGAGKWSLDYVISKRK